MGRAWPPGAATTRARPRLGRLGVDDDEAEGRRWCSCSVRRAGADGRAGRGVGALSRRAQEQLAEQGVGWRQRRLCNGVQLVVLRRGVVRQRRRANRRRRQRSGSSGRPSGRSCPIWSVCICKGVHYDEAAWSGAGGRGRQRQCGARGDGSAAAGEGGGWGWRRGGSGADEWRGCGRVWAVCGQAVERGGGVGRAKKRAASSRANRLRRRSSNVVSCIVASTSEGISTKASFHSCRNGVDRATNAKREPSRGAVTRVSCAMLSESPTSRQWPRCGKQTTRETTTTKTKNAHRARCG